jgi:hypothetical protein
LSRKAQWNAVPKVERLVFALRWPKGLLSLVMVSCQLHPSDGSLF